MLYKNINNRLNGTQFSYVFFCLSFGGEAIQEKKTFSSRRNDNRTIA